MVDVNLAGDRRLILQHRAMNRILLEEKDARMVLQHIADLWGYDVVMKEIDPATDAVLKEHAASPKAGDRADRNQTELTVPRGVRPGWRGSAPILARCDSFSLELATQGYCLGRSSAVGSTSTSRRSNTTISPIPGNAPAMQTA